MALGALIDEHRAQRHAFLRAELGERGVGVGCDHAAPAAARGQCGEKALLSRLAVDDHHHRSEEHTSKLQSLMRLSYAVFCLKKKKNKRIRNNNLHTVRQTTSTKK